MRGPCSDCHAPGIIVHFVRIGLCDKIKSPMVRKEESS